ncbi:hypothetical protein RRG08_014667 [Elysia crispata]|uniref:Uncharacterized protein n=1 Tax=Elysia crispata TaxID=231223 RepID=A0AAE1CZK2_9GAST|nr:hypothetical protein RRG08_014667 [Elysia crispata]
MTYVLSITCVVFAVAQSISLRSSSLDDRTCESLYLLAGVDEIVVTVQMRSSEAPDESYTVDNDTAYFRRMSGDGTHRVLCRPELKKCDLGPAQLKNKSCACVAIKNITYTLAFKLKSSIDLNGSVIDFVWHSNSLDYIRSDDVFKVPPIVTKCRKAALIYISPHTWYLILLGLGTAINLFLTLVGCAAMCYFWKADKGGVRSRCEHLCGKCPCAPLCQKMRERCTCVPFCKSSGDDSGSSSEGGSDESGSSHEGSPGGAESTESEEKKTATGTEKPESLTATSP